MEAGDFAADSDIQKFLHEGLYSSKDVGEIKNALEISSEVDMTLAYASEKLANLENLLLHVLAGENDIGAIEVEKAFTLDLLHVILNVELKEMDNFISDLQDLIVDALRKVYSCEHSTELLSGLISKLHDSEELLKLSQERVLEMKIQLVKLQMTSYSYQWKHGLVMAVEEKWKPEIQTIEEIHVVRMLEKSLAREVELEKKLTELRQNEEDLKLKIRLTEQVAVGMEEAAEVAWGRFLEADNAAEVLMGISKEILGKLQINRKLQDCMNQINAKETSIQKLNSRIAQLVADNFEATGLREKLKRTESMLEEANASRETSQRQIKEMGGEIECLMEKTYAAESRAENAEEKVTHLTESSLELTEELDFVKGCNDSNTKKVSLLEKQLRELDIQLQHARASAEASQEQQNMLYSAIWDMETLIDELKQKVVTAENAEEQCIMLSETNSELKEELVFVRSRMEFMETSLNEATLERKSCAEDISIRTSLIMETVMQLAMERDRIQKQLISLTEENKLLREKLRKERKHAPATLHSADYESAKTSTVKATDISSESFQSM